MMTMTSRESTRQAGHTDMADEGRARGQAPAAPRAANPVWTGLALSSGAPAIQRKCAACAGGGTCQACEEEQHGGGA